MGCHQHYFEIRCHFIYRWQRSNCQNMFKYLQVLFLVFKLILFLWILQIVSSSPGDLYDLYLTVVEIFNQLIINKSILCLQKTLNVHSSVCVICKISVCEMSDKLFIQLFFSFSNFLFNDKGAYLIILDWSFLKLNLILCCILIALT